MGYALILDLAGALAFGTVIGWVAGTMLRRELRGRLTEITAIFGTLFGGAATAALTDYTDALALYCVGFVLAFMRRILTTSRLQQIVHSSTNIVASISSSRLQLKIIGSFQSGIRIEALRDAIRQIQTTNVLPELSESREQGPADAAPSARVLNANFADLGTGRILESNEMLLSDTFYDLLVDIGPPWINGLSIVSGSKIFPEDQLPQDPEGHQIQVVFISEDFAAGEESATTGPHIATAMLWLPSAGGPSHPFVEGKVRDNPGPVALRLKTPWMYSGTARELPQPSRAMYGRICLYFENNLLQSAVVRAHVGPPEKFKSAFGPSPTPGRYSHVKNAIEVDFVLTGFRNIEELSARKIEPLSPHASTKGEPITLNLTLNDDGSGNHRIVISSLGEPACIRYDPVGSEKLLADARGIIGDCYWQRNKDGTFVVDSNEKRKLALAPDNGKSLVEFKWDLLNLADYGSKLFGLIFTNVIPPKGKTQLQWIAQLRSALAGSATIQVSRTGPAQYVFPWGLVYDYPLVADENYRFCPILEEWGPDSRRADGPIPASCPHEHEAFHQQNVICPYGFWGLRHRIEQPPSLPKGDEIQLEAKRAIGSGQRLDFHAAFTSDATLNQNLITGHITNLKAIQRLEFAPPPASDWAGVRAALKAPQVVYFLCHGEFDVDRKESYLGVGMRDDDPRHRVYVSKLNSFMTSPEINPDEWARLAPLIVINGCHTTDLAPGQLLNFVSSFASAGASGIIGTEVSVILPVAVEVGEMLFAGLTRNEAVADVIRSIRWRLANRGNLLGLAYTPYCLADLRVRYDS